MKYFIISDIHEDFYSLENVLNFITKEECYKVISLGDNVGFSEHYNFKNTINRRNADKSIDLLIEEKVISILGNHDFNFLNKAPKNSFYLINNITIDQRWLYEDELKTTFNDRSNVNYLDDLDELFIDGNVLFSHFLFPDLSGMLKLTKESIKSLVKTHFLFMDSSGLKISFVGHTHIKFPLIISDNGQEFKLLNTEDEIKLNFKENSYIVFCPPILSYLSKKSSFVSYCDQSRTIKHWCINAN